MPIPAENIAAALAFSSLVRSLEETVQTLTTDNERLERELTNTQVDLRAAKTELTQLQEESQQALESLTKKCLAFEEELSKCVTVLSYYLCKLKPLDDRTLCQSPSLWLLVPGLSSYGSLAACF